MTTAALSRVWRTGPLSPLLHQKNTPARLAFWLILHRPNRLDHTLY